MDQNLIPVRVTLTSIARDDQGEEDQPIRVLTTGKLRKTPSGYMLRYEETSVDDATGQAIVSPVILAMQPGRVVMTRTGDFGTTMMFMKDTRFEGQYHTPYGEMALALFPTCVSTRLGTDKGSVRLEYQIEMNGRFVSSQTINLEYVAEGGPVC